MMVHYRGMTPAFLLTLGKLRNGKILPRKDLNLQPNDPKSLALPVAPLGKVNQDIIFDFKIMGLKFLVCC